MQHDSYSESPLEVEEIQKKKEKKIRQSGASVALTAKGMLKKYLWLNMNINQ